MTKDRLFQRYPQQLPELLRSTMWRDLKAHFNSLRPCYTLHLVSAQDLTEHGAALAQRESGASIICNAMETLAEEPATEAPIEETWEQPEEKP